MKTTTTKTVSIELTADEVFTAILDYLPSKYKGKYFFLDSLSYIHGAKVTADETVETQG